MKTLIRVDQLTKHFDDLVILDKLSFDIAEGTVLSILGPSGSGKTTLLRCLIGLETFSSPASSIQIDGMDSQAYLKQRRIAFVPQRYSNYPWLNVFDNIKLGMRQQAAIPKPPTFILPIANRYAPFAIAANIDQEAEQATANRQDQRVNEIIEMVGLQGFGHYPINKLSGGMQQRVAIGRAIAQDSDIIAFDEPFGALDFKIREKLQLLVKQLKKTIIFVTHDIEEAIFLGDQLIVLSTIPTQITNTYKLPFRPMMDADLKFDEAFVGLRKKIQSEFLNERVEL